MDKGLDGQLEKVVDTQLDEFTKVLAHQKVVLKEEQQRLKAQLAKTSLKVQHLAERKTIQVDLYDQDGSSVNRMFSVRSNGPKAYLE